MREEWTTFLKDVLDQACTGNLEVLIGYNCRIPAFPPRPARKCVTRQPRAARADPDRSGRKRKRSLSRALPAGSARSAYGGMEASDAPESSGVSRSRKTQRRWPRSTSRPRRRLESQAPSTARVHREEDECPLLGRTSTKSAKTGRISDLTYDCIQEEKIQISCTREGRNVEYALECEPDYDIERAVIDAALNDQAADLDYRDELNVSFVSVCSSID